MEILKLESKWNEKENHWGTFSRLEIIEEELSKCDDRSIEIIQSEE